MAISRGLAVLSGQPSILVRLKAAGRRCPPLLLLRHIRTSKRADLERTPSLQGRGFARLAGVPVLPLLRAVQDG